MPDPLVLLTGGYLLFFHSPIPSRCEHTTDKRHCRRTDCRVRTEAIHQAVGSRISSRFYRAKGIADGRLMIQLAKIPGIPSAARPVPRAGRLTLGEFGLLWFLRSCLQILNAFFPLIPGIRQAAAAKGEPVSLAGI